MVRTDVNGHHLWNKTFGGSTDEHARYMIQNTNGEFVLVGWTKSYGAGGLDVWLIKTSDAAAAITTPPTTLTTPTPTSFPSLFILFSVVLPIIVRRKKNSSIQSKAPN